MNTRVFLLVTFALLAILLAVATEGFDGTSFVGKTWPPRGVAHPKPGHYVTSDLTHENSINVKSSSGKPLKIDVSLARAGLALDTSYQFPGTVMIDNIDVIPGRMPWDVVYHTIPKKEVDLTFSRTYCPGSSAFNKATLKIKGSHDRTSNSPGLVHVQAMGYDAQLSAGKFIRETMGQGVVYHYFDVKDTSRPIHLRANAYFPWKDAADEGFTVFLSKDVCPDFSHHEAPHRESCEVTLNYNQAKTTYEIVLTTTMDTSDTQELSFILPPSFSHVSDYTHFDIYGDDVSGHTHAERFVLIFLRGDTGSKAQSGKKKTRTMKGLIVRGNGASAPSTDVAKEFSTFALNGKRCQTTVNILGPTKKVIDTWISHDPKNTNSHSMQQWNTKDGIYTLEKNGKDGNQLSPGRYYVAMVWDHPYGILGYELGFWQGGADSALSIALSALSPGSSDNDDKKSVQVAQDTELHIPIRVHDDAGENRPVLELEMIADKGSLLKLLDTRGIVITSGEYHLGDLKERIAIEGDATAIQRILNEAMFFQSEKYYTGESKISARLIDKSCFACSNQAPKIMSVAVGIEYTKIEHPLEYDMKSDKINVVHQKGTVVIPDILKNIRSVDVHDNAFRNLMQVELVQVDEGHVVQSSVGSHDVSQDGLTASRNNPSVQGAVSSSKLFRSPPKLRLDNGRTKADLELDLTGEFGRAVYSVVLSNPSLTGGSGTFVHRESITIGVFPSTCDVHAVTGRKVVSRFAPAKVNVSLSSEPFDVVNIPVRISREGVAEISTEMVRFTPGDWGTKILLVRGQETGDTDEFTVDFGPIDSNDTRLKAKRQNVTLVNGNSRDDCVPNDSRWFCQDTASSAVVRQPFSRLGMWIALGIAIVGVFHFC